MDTMLSLGFNDSFCLNEMTMPTCDCAGSNCDCNDCKCDCVWDCNCNDGDCGGTDC